MDWKFISIVYDSEKTFIAISEKHVWHIAQKNTYCNPRKTRLVSQNIRNCNQESIVEMRCYYYSEKHALQSQKKTRLASQNTWYCILRNVTENQLY